MGLFFRLVVDRRQARRKKRNMVFPLLVRRVLPAGYPVNVKVQPVKSPVRDALRVLE
jgi:hypothetical protein